MDSAVIAGGIGDLGGRGKLSLPVLMECDKGTESAALDVHGRLEERSLKE